MGEKSLLYGVARDLDVFVSSESCLAAFLDQTSFEAVSGPRSYNPALRPSL